MKKSVILRKLSRENPDALTQIQNLQRGKIYLVEGAPRLKNIPILVTHFYKNGVRFKPLTDFPSPVFWGVSLNVTPPSVPSTIRYAKVAHMTFKELRPTDLPLYLDKASKYMEEFFKNYKKGKTSCPSGTTSAS